MLKKLDTLLIEKEAREYREEKENKLLDFYLHYSKDIEAIDTYFDIQGGYSYQSFYRGNTNYSRYAAFNGIVSDTNTIDEYDPDPTEYLKIGFIDIGMKWKISKGTKILQASKRHFFLFPTNSFFLNKND